MIHASVKKPSGQKVPLVLGTIRAGFPSPAEDYIERKIDLQEELVHHPASTFFVRVEGDSMRDAGIHPGDLLVVDRSLTPKKGDVVLAIVESEFTVKYFIPSSRGVVLRPANDQYQDICIQATDDFEIWGVVTNSVRNFRPA